MGRRPDFASVRVNNAFGTLAKVTLREAIRFPDSGVLRGFLIGSIRRVIADSLDTHDYSKGVDIDLDAEGIRSEAYDISGNEEKVIRAWLEKADKVVIRTPKTIEGVMSWVNAKIAKNPTRTDDDFGSVVEVTVEDVLIDILIGSADANDGLSSNLAVELLKHGFKGYRNMSREELLGFIQTEFLDYSEIHDDLEDLLAAYGIADSDDDE